MCGFSNQQGKLEMFSHIMIGTNDVARSKTFYDALLGASLRHAYGGV